MTEFVFNLPPKKAIEWLQRRKISVKPRNQMTPLEAARSFTVAKITSLDMLQNIQNALLTAAQQGTPYRQFKQEVLQHMQAAGWLHTDDNGKPEIIDPDTGEIFGRPRRLENIYQTNMQSALSAARYHSLMENSQNRPYWQYSAVNDSRTRPAHAAMSGLVYRYDDPFWETFYPPNGYRCRCTVIALAARDIDRRNITISESGDSSFSPVALSRPDKGFNYNVGKINYRPNLNNYDKRLAQQFAKADLTGAEFKAYLNRLPDTKAKFAAGVLTDENQQLLQLQYGCVWLTDDVLKSQINQIEQQAYAVLPDLINDPALIFQDGDYFYLIGGDKLAILKETAQGLQVQSYRQLDLKELKLLQQTKQQLK